MNVSVNFKSNLLLFVAGLSSKSTPEQVLLYFGELGRVRLLRLRNSKKGIRLQASNSQNNLRRGFCVVETFEESVFRAALGRSDSIFNGRKLIITPLMEKPKFHAHLADLEKRKIVVTRVPPQVSTSNLQSAIEIQFGGIRKVSKLDHPADSSNSIVSRSYLVEFIDQSAARLASQVGRLLIYFKDNPVTLVLLAPSDSTESAKVDRLSSGSSSAINSQGDRKNIDNKQVENLESLKDRITVRNHETTRSSNHKLHFAKPTSHGYHHGIRADHFLRRDDNWRNEPDINLRFNILIG